MSDDFILILPAPATLDSIREVLAPHFTLNPKIPDLGDVEELDAHEPCGGLSKFWRIPKPPSDELLAKLQAHGSTATRFEMFNVDVMGRERTLAPILTAARALHGLIYDVWGDLHTPNDLPAAMERRADELRKQLVKQWAAVRADSKKA